MSWQGVEIKKLEPDSKHYPNKLRELKDPPKQIYYRGELDIKIFRKALAVVGTRKMSRYGRAVLERFIPDLVSQNITIVSGFMYGVDTEAHRLTVENGGRTVAVFGSGINQIYPEENSKLYTKILVNKGVVMSEYFPEMKPKLWSYVQRNRVVAALSNLGVLVIEAGEKSGSQITAENARALGLPVYAVPGSIVSEMSRGTNNMIKNALAQAVTKAADIKGVVKFPSNARKKNQPELTGIEKEICDELSTGELAIDELAASLGKNVVEVGNTLSIMAIRGVVSEVGGKFFVVSNLP